MYRAAYKLYKEAIVRKIIDSNRALCKRSHVKGILISLFTGDKLIIDPCDTGLSVDLIINNGIRESCSVKQMLNILKNDRALQHTTFLDVGANIGYFTVIFGKYFNKIVAIEPIERSIELLRENIKLNNLVTKTEVIPAAVSRNSQKVRMMIRKELNLSKVVSSKSADEDVITVRAVPLRELIRRNAPVGLLKIDVEGYEWELLGRELPFNKENAPKYIYLELHTRILGVDKSLMIMRNLLQYYNVKAVCFEPNLNVEPFMSFWKKFLRSERLCIEEDYFTREGDAVDKIKNLLDTTLSPKKVYAPRFILNKK